MRACSNCCTAPAGGRGRARHRRGEGYLARRVHELIVRQGLAARVEACDLFPDNFRVPEVALPRDDLQVVCRCRIAAWTWRIRSSYRASRGQFAFLREVQRVLRPGGRFVSRRRTCSA